MKTLLGAFVLGISQQDGSTSLPSRSSQHVSASTPAIPLALHLGSCFGSLASERTVRDCEAAYSGEGTDSVVAEGTKVQSFGYCWHSQQQPIQTSSLSCMSFCQVLLFACRSLQVSFEGFVPVLLLLFIYLL